MKIFTNKKIVQKIIIAILIVLSFNFITPTYSQADVGGVLMGPIIDFISGIGDAILSALQFFMYDGNVSLGSAAGSAVSGALKIVNPYDSFMLMRSDGNFDDKLKQYGMDVTQAEKDANIKEKPETAQQDGADISINADEFDKGWWSWIGVDKDYGVPVIKYTPEKIFSNQVPALDVNFINPKPWHNQNMDSKSVTQLLHSTIANWYIALRNLAIVALLSVLLYVGIRMVISSTASDKAKYKQMLLDWIVALCIVFFLHYIMSFILSVTQMITEGVDSGTEVIVQVTDTQTGKGNFTYKTDLTGLCRLQVQYANLGGRLIYLIFYIAIVIYTVMFTWTYVKRAITMAFLTLMAPLVAITYPIDKIGDGKAQAYGIWLKEFIFNSLLQPFHLIIYTIFLGAASEIAVMNPIYAILFLAFIIPSEKLLRSMFGFDKASTAGSFAAGFGGAAAFNTLKNAVSKGESSSKGNNPSQDKVRTKKPIKDKNKIGKDYSAFSDGSGFIPGSGSGGEDEGGAPSPSGGAPSPSGGAPSPSGGAPSPSGGTPSPSGRAPSPSGGAPSSSGRAPSPSGRAPSPSGGTALPKKRGIVRKTLGGIGNMGKHAGRYTLNKAKTNFTPRKIANFAGRTAVKGLSAAAFGAIGLGMGIAGGNLEDVLTMGLGGTALGGKVVGNKLSNAGGKFMHNAAHNVGSAFGEGYHGKNEYQMRQQAKEFKQNEENREFFRDAYDAKGKELREIMDSAADMNNQGINDLDEIKDTIDLETGIRQELSDSGYSEEDSARLAHAQAITIAKQSRHYDTDKLMTDEKYRQGVYDHIQRTIKKGNSSISDEELKQQSDRIMQLTYRHKKID